MKPKLTLPTIHLNGTSAKALLEAIEEAYSAVGEAQRKLAQTAPNGRDYYVQQPGALEAAQAEHQSRMERLQSVRRELEEIAEGLPV